MLNDHDIDLLAIHAAGARMQPEKSYARPAWQYGDPSRFVKLRSEEHCGTCRHAQPGNNGLACSKGNKFGTRCHQFTREKQA